MESMLKKSANYFKAFFLSLKHEGLSLVISKFFPGFLNFFQVLKIHIYWSIFSSLRLKTVLNSIKSLKRYSKASFNTFFNKKYF